MAYDDRRYQKKIEILPEESHFLSPPQKNMLILNMFSAAKNEPTVPCCQVTPLNLGYD